MMKVSEAVGDDGDVEDVADIPAVHNGVLLSPNLSSRAQICA